MSKPENIANLKDASEKAEKEYVTLNTKVATQLRMALELRVAIANCEYELNEAIGKLDEQMRVIKETYKK